MEKLWHQNKCCDDHFHVFFAGEVTKFYTNSKKFLFSVAINPFYRKFSIHMINNEKQKHTTIERAFGCYSMSSSCKVIGFHKWSLKLAKMYTDRTLVTCFK